VQRVVRGESNGAASWPVRSDYYIGKRKSNLDYMEIAQGETDK
jgi:hypothetical protein